MQIKAFSPILSDMSSAKINFSRDKLRAAVLHVIGQCKPDRLGAVKLHKVLYYSDMLTFLDTGQPVTGAEYRKRPFGPTCDAVLSVLDELARTGDVSIERVDYHGFLKKQFKLNGSPDTNQLSADEKTTLNEMVDFVCNNNSAKTISDFSHDMVWEMVEFGDIIPYHNAIHLIPNIASPDAVAWGEAEAEKIAGHRSKSQNSPLAGIDSGAFRSRLVELSRRRSV
ncbi:SocA family protein [Mesorhizobium sp. CA18]|uniref:Panacea domain-containing protein n=1 Tax=unclassified Mesorhizobium TaxID=325217 RepID=UPI001CC9A865|nr:MULTISPECIES: Panacea domain-containing protein [unclassified Mesorhizobium]MBZ9736344.1 SocA family protein [Mesorhizobium sp. CA9]MBZ9829180.1 SocA family protein [Mesorhizobium sp. CA18]MBZ9833861.1 SocA family protein [Mesorhizobium sp. CA2]MBZ9840032.1 SocA family protein [Mesorhizobium sp. CA3]MBZ9880211.1 SocA family protein [Mesorhizobium sp. Ca11]